MHRESKLTRVLNATGFDADSGMRQRFNNWIRMRRALRDAKDVQPHVSYSQCAEDAILQTLVSPTPGTYIDIGSGHPIRGSNTYALYQRGWSGLLVDPLQANTALSQRLRPRDAVVSGLCGQKDVEAIEFFEYDIYEYSTASRPRVDELAKRGHLHSQSYDLSVLSLATLVDRFNLSSASVLSIDVEGFELDVLAGNDWESFRPEFIVVEEWDPPVPNPTDIYRYLADLQYTLIAFNRASTVYRAT
jgi:FkbM family methyltransferase